MARCGSQEIGTYIIDIQLIQDPTKHTPVILGHHFF